MRWPSRTHLRAAFAQALRDLQVLFSTKIRPYSSRAIEDSDDAPPSTVSFKRRSATEGDGVDVPGEVPAEAVTEQDSEECTEEVE